jgi:hypothetical protein
MPQGKWHVYENDIRVPMMIRGPGILPNSTFAQPATNVDIMPTILELAGVDTPTSMDGRSVLPLLFSRELITQVPEQTRRQWTAAMTGPRTAGKWRPGVLVEYLGLGDVIRYEQCVFRSGMGSGTSGLSWLHGRLTPLGWQFGGRQQQHVSGTSAGRSRRIGRMALGGIH